MNEYINNGFKILIISFVLYKLYHSFYYTETLDNIEIHNVSEKTSKQSTEKKLNTIENINTIIDNSDNTKSFIIDENIDTTIDDLDQDNTRSLVAFNDDSENDIESTDRCGIHHDDDLPEHFSNIICCLSKNQLIVKWIPFKTYTKYYLQLFNLQTQSVYITTKINTYKGVHTFVLSEEGVYQISVLKYGSSKCDTIKNIVDKCYYFCDCTPRIRLCKTQPHRELFVFWNVVGYHCGEYTLNLYFNGELDASYNINLSTFYTGSFKFPIDIMEGSYKASLSNGKCDIVSNCVEFECECPCNLYLCQTTNGLLYATWDINKDAFYCGEYILYVYKNGFIDASYNVDVSDGYLFIPYNTTEDTTATYNIILTNGSCVLTSKCIEPGFECDCLEQLPTFIDISRNFNTLVVTWDTEATFCGSYTLQLYKDNSLNTVYPVNPLSGNYIIPITDGSDNSYYVNLTNNDVSACDISSATIDVVCDCIDGSLNLVVQRTAVPNQLELISTWDISNNSGICGTYTLDAYRNNSIFTSVSNIDITTGTYTVYYPSDISGGFFYTVLRNDFGCEIVSNIVLKGLIDMCVDLSNITLSDNTRVSFLIIGAGASSGGSNGGGGGALTWFNNYYTVGTETFQAVCNVNNRYSITKGNTPEWLYAGNGQTNGDNGESQDPLTLPPGDVSSNTGGGGGNGGDGGDTGGGGGGTAGYCCFGGDGGDGGTGNNAGDPGLAGTGGGGGGGQGGRNSNNAPGRFGGGGGGGTGVYYIGTDFTAGFDGIGGVGGSTGGVGGGGGSYNYGICGLDGDTGSASIGGDGGLYGGGGGTLSGSGNDPSASGAGAIGGVWMLL